MRAKSTGVIEPRGSDHLGERQQRIAVEIINTVGLVAHNKRTLTYRIRGRDPRRTLVGMTGERLAAADPDHEAPPRIGPDGAERPYRGDIEGANVIAGRAESKFLPTPPPDQRRWRAQHDLPP